MDKIDLGKCEVCKKNDAITVRASCLGAFSFCFCRECLEADKEPRWLAQYTVANVGGYENLAEWVKPVIDASLNIDGKGKASDEPN